MAIRGLIDSATGQEITDMTDAKSEMGLGNVDSTKLALAEASAPAAVASNVIVYVDSADGVLKARLPNGDIYGLIAHKLS